MGWHRDELRLGNFGLHISMGYSWACDWHMRAFVSFVHLLVGWQVWESSLRLGAKGKKLIRKGIYTGSVPRVDQNLGAVKYFPSMESHMCAEVHQSLQIFANMYITPGPRRVISVPSQGP